jgi:eukaryotic-like serine/threonine-protein kinase
MTHHGSGRFQLYDATHQPRVRSVTTKEEGISTFETLWETLQVAGLDDTVPVDQQMSVAAGGSPKALLTSISQLTPARVDPEQLALIQPADDAGGAADITVLSRLGKGGMGRVDLAIQRSLGRHVALKTLERPNASQADALIREALFTGHLEHPNIVPVHHLGRYADGRPVLLMKRVVGVSWRTLLDDPQHPQWAKLPSDRLRFHIEVLKQVCNAVHFAHSKGVIHRDIKPANVMIGEFGEVYLVDWGAAEVISGEPGSGRITGTPVYMAPEMVCGGTLDERTDVYLLGGTLHRVLTGTPRHKGERVHAVMWSVSRSEPVAYEDSVPADLGELCNQATSLSPADRPESARAFADALTTFLDRRSSIELTQVAHRSLGALRIALATDSERRNEYIAACLAECRFGFQQALREWPRNLQAIEGLQVSLELVLDNAITQRNVGLAAALLDELPKANPELAARANILQGESDEELRQATLYREAEDLTLSGRKRAVFQMLLGFLAGGATLLVGRRHRMGTPFTHQEAVAVVVVAEALLIGLTYVWREALFRNAVNRRLVTGVLVGGAAVLINRVVAVITGLDITLVLTQDLLLITATTAILAMTVRLGYWIPVGIGVVCILVSASFPERSFDALAFFFVVASIPTAYQWRQATE